MELAGSSSSLRPQQPQRATRGAMAAAAAAKAEATGGSGATGGTGAFGRELSLNVLQGQEPALPLASASKKATAAAAAAASMSKGQSLTGSQRLDRDGPIDPNNQLID